MSRRTRLYNGFEGQLANDVSVGAVSVELTDVTGLQAPGRLVIDYRDPLLREWFEFAGIAGKVLTGVSRAMAGSSGAGGAVAHGAGALVRSVPMHQHFDDLFSDIEDLEEWNDDHQASADPHPGYATDANLAATNATVSAHTLDITQLEESYTLLGSDVDDLQASTATHYNSTTGHPVVSASSSGFMTAAQFNTLNRIGETCRLSTSASQGLAANFDFVSFDTEHEDPGNWHPSGSAAAITVPFTGIYQCRLDLASPIERSGILRINSATAGSGTGLPMARGQSATGATQSARIHVSGPIRLAANAVVRVELAGDGPGPVGAGSEFVISFTGRS